MNISWAEPGASTQHSRVDSVTQHDAGRRWKGDLLTIFPQLYSSFCHDETNGKPTQTLLILVTKKTLFLNCKYFKLVKGYRRSHGQTGTWQNE